MYRLVSILAEHYILSTRSILLLNLFQIVFRYSIIQFDFTLVLRWLFIFSYLLQLFFVFGLQVKNRFLHVTTSLFIFFETKLSSATLHARLLSIFPNLFLSSFLHVRLLSTSIDLIAMKRKFICFDKNLSFYNMLSCL